MPLPGLFGLVLISFVCGAVAAAVTRGRRPNFAGATLVGMAAALAGGLLAPWAGAMVGFQVDALWMVAVAAAAMSLAVLGGLAAVLSRR